MPIVYHALKLGSSTYIVPIEIYTDIMNSELLFDDLRLDDSDYQARVENIRNARKDEGFEAIAWFQPYHVWTEETWGIYFDARKIDDLALSLVDDFRVQRVHGSHRLAALLAFGLTYAHEMFHARVEAVLSYDELNSRRPRYLRYNEKVYDALRQTPDWLEEALARLILDACQIGPRSWFRGLAPGF